MLWDPFRVSPAARRWLWASLAAWLLLLRGPVLLESLTGSWKTLPDFFQEWASARNLLEGLPIYSDHNLTINKYLWDPRDRPPLVRVNAHPPTSVLLALPLASLDFFTAFRIWNLGSLAVFALSLWLVCKSLRIPFAAWSIWPLTAVLLLFDPLREQLRQGQLSAVLALLVVGAWVAERSGRYRLSGSLLGVAVAIKLFPGFLVIYYAFRRRWRIVSSAAATLALLSGLTLVVLGWGAYRDYALHVLPEFQWFRVGWDNASITGFWSKLFDPAPERVRQVFLTEPLLYSPLIARAGALISSLALVAILAWSVRGVRSRTEEDRDFGLAVTAMLLVSPITWSHYFLLLSVPLALVWTKLPQARLWKASFLVIVCALWARPAVIWSACGLTHRAATPAEALTALSCQLYALLGLFVSLLLLPTGTDPGLAVDVSTARSSVTNRPSSD